MCYTNVYIYEIILSATVFKVNDELFKNNPIINGIRREE